MISLGGGYPNPIDTGNPNNRELSRILNIIGCDANIDNIVLIVGARWGVPKNLREQIKALASVREKNSKPVLAIASFSTPTEMRRVRNISQEFLKGGIPTFTSMEKAAFALRNALEYYRLQSNSDKRN